MYVISKLPPAVCALMGKKRLYFRAIHGKIQMRSTYDSEKRGGGMLRGVDYYPEQWADDLLEEDLDRIVELGCNVIRVGEFAWHKIEPQEGRYDFSYFDRVIREAAKRGLQVILGTPTATQPAWLMEQSEDVRSYFEDGTPRTFGGRHVACPSSPRYREACDRIITALAYHYRTEPNIVAWQIDNELGHEGSDQCWCSHCQKAFRGWLKNKYRGRIQAFNQACGTIFWGQTYDNFDQIPLPKPTITTHNPALRLEWERFCAHRLEAFAAFQAELLHRILPRAVVIHDFPGGGLEKRADYAAIASHLDRAAYNNYPVWGGQREPLPPEEIAFGLDYIRGLKGENFWITEAIMGAQGHDITGYLPRPGQARLWSWQGMVHGCEGLLYFRYRGAAQGAEQFCYGILDPDNVPRRRFFEAQRFFREVEDYADVLTAPVKSKAAILYDYDALASLRIQRQSVLMDSCRTMKRFHGICCKAGQTVDVLPAAADFSGYSLVILPQMTVTDRAFLDRLRRFVAEGGVAVATYRTAVKDRNNNLVFGKVLPVDCDDLFGLQIEESESVQAYDCIPLVAPEGRRGRGGIFREMAAPTTAEVLWRYDDFFYRQYAAITCNRWGKGSAYYFATEPEEEILTEVLHRAMDQAGMERLTLPAGVEAVVRESGEKRVRFLLNHTDRTVEVLGRTLEPYGVAAVPVEE